MASGAGGQRLLAGEEKALGKLKVRERCTLQSTCLFFYLLRLKFGWTVRQGRCQDTAGWCFLAGGLLFLASFERESDVSLVTAFRSGFIPKPRTRGTYSPMLPCDCFYFLCTRNGSVPLLHTWKRQQHTNS